MRARAASARVAVAGGGGHDVGQLVDVERATEVAVHDVAPMHDQEGVGARSSVVELGVLAGAADGVTAGVVEVEVEHPGGGSEQPDLGPGRGIGVAQAGQTDEHGLVAAGRFAPGPGARREVGGRAAVLDHQLGRSDQARGHQVVGDSRQHIVAIEGRGPLEELFGDANVDPLAADGGERRVAGVAVQGMGEADAVAVDRDHAELDGGVEVLVDGGRRR